MKNYILFKDKFFISFMLVLTFLLLFSLSSVSADEYNFTSSNTSADFQSVINDTTPNELVINLADGNYSLSQINITRNATIKGNSSNVKINGSGILFNITASNVKIINLTITGFKTAILTNKGDLMIIGNNINTKNTSIDISGSDLNGINISDNLIISNISELQNGIVLVYNSGMICAAFVNNSITNNGGYTAVGVNVYDNGNSSNLTFIDNNIKASFSTYFTLKNNNTNVNFTNNNLTTLSMFIEGKDSNITLTNNNITGSNNGASVVFENNNTNVIFTNNNITGSNNGVGFFFDNGFTTNNVMFLNNIINANTGLKFSTESYDYRGPVNIGGFIRGNTIFASNAGLNFTALNSSSLVNITVEYNCILSPVGVDITGRDNGSSFDYNWWGVNDITGKLLGINTSNHFILNIINLTSLDNLKSGDNVSFAFLVLNSTSDGNEIENLPYFTVNGNYNGVNFTVDTVNNFTGNFTVSGVGMLAATLDSQSASLIFNTNSTISVDSVQIGTNASISGQLDGYVGNGTDLLNVTVDGNLKTATINSTGDWNLTYLTNRTGNITVNIVYFGNGSYPGFTNTTTFEVLKNSTNSTISVSGDFIVDGNLLIVGVLSDGSGNFISGASIFVSVKGTFIGSTITDVRGSWALIYTLAYAGDIPVTVSFGGNENYTAFTNSTVFNVAPANTHLSIIVPNSGVVGTNVVITGVLTAFNGKVLPNTKLTLNIGGTLNTVVTDNNGQWYALYTPKKAGNLNARISFAGSDDYLASSSVKSFSVISKSNIRITSVKYTKLSKKSAKKVLTLKNFGTTGSQTVYYKYSSRYWKKLTFKGYGLKYSASYNKKTKMVTIKVKNLEYNKQARLKITFKK